MTTQCFELMSLPLFENIHLVAGQDGLFRKVTWVYVLQTPSLRNWVSGGEFLFVLHQKNITQVLQEAVQFKLSGVVLLKNEENQSLLTDELISYANEENLPLFEMDYHIRLIDITREISEYIIHKQEENNAVNRFFYHVLFSDENHRGDIEDLAAQYSFHADDLMFVIAIRSPKPYHLPQILSSLRNHLMDNERHTLSLIMEESLLVLVYGQKERLEKYKKSLSSIFDVIREEFDNEIRIGVGDVRSSLYEVKESYANAVKCISLCSPEEPLVDYDKLSFQRLLLNSKQAPEFKAYVDFMLHDIIAYDKKNNNNFLEMIENYILYNGNINKTAAKMYIHRNTCIYRIEKLKESFNIDLDDAYTRADLLNCLQIYHYFKMDS